MLALGNRGCVLDMSKLHVHFPLRLHIRSILELLGAEVPSGGLKHSLAGASSLQRVCSPLRCLLMVSIFHVIRQFFFLSTNAE